MYRFEELEQLYASITALEKALERFSSCAIYELDGGIEVWCETKTLILQNIAAQKQLLRRLIAVGKFTLEQQKQAKSWQLG